VFDRTPLREALADVQRHRSAPIRLHDDGRLGRHAISGVFEAERTDQMLDLLPRIVPAQVQRRADGSVDIAPAAR
jgi:transmembrane sensor